RDPSNIFCDQTVFIEYLQEHGNDRGRLVIPGSVITLQDGRADISHPVPNHEVQAIFRDKRGYLHEYKERQQPVIDAIKAGWPHGQIDVLSSIKERFEPLLALADLTCRGVNARVLLDCRTEQIVIDFMDRTVYRWNGEYCRYRFRIAPELVASCLMERHGDWVE